MDPAALDHEFALTYQNLPDAARVYLDAAGEAISRGEDVGSVDTMGLSDAVEAAREAIVVAHKIACTDDPKFERERAMLNTNVVPSLEVVSGVVLAFSIGDAQAKAISVAALKMVFQFGRSVFCRATVGVTRK